MTDPEQALSFAAVAGAYHRARPGYPREAATWLAGPEARRVLELGAGTGKLTGELLATGREVVATDPLAGMLRLLREHHRTCAAVVGTAEAIPLAARSVDTVVCAQSFHWFDLDRALPEIARVLRPGGRLALAWNVRDDRIPWVRRLGELLRGDGDRTGTGSSSGTDPTQRLVGSQLFGFVESSTYRFWQPLDKERLRELALSRSYVAVRPPAEREALLDRIDAFYDDYGRGHDGMLLPYLTRCYAATVRAPAAEERGRPTRPGAPPTEPPTESHDGDDPGSLLIDFS